MSRDAVIARLRDELALARVRIEQLERMLNVPEIENFQRGVRLEAAHQRARWGSSHDVGKTPEDWFWLLGYLGGKALHAAKMGDAAKARHHCISTAAALANWHAYMSDTADVDSLRPGIDSVERGLE